MRVPNLSFFRNYLRQRLPLEVLKRWRIALRYRLLQKVKVIDRSNSDSSPANARIEFSQADEFVVKDILHLETLPSEIQNCLGRFQIPSSYVIEVHDAELVGPYAVGFERDQIIGETTLPSFYPIDTGVTSRTLIAKRLAFRRSIKTPIAHCLINTWSHNYFHWLIDCLTRLEGVEFYQNQTGCRPKLLLQPSLKTWQLESLRLLGYSEEDYLYWTQRRSQVETLIVPSHRYNALHAPSPAACHWLKRTLLDRLQAAPPQSFSPRILISRAKAAGRKVLNEAEVIHVLAPLGFQVYSLEDLSFSDQVHLFSQAEIVVAPHGAGLTNMIFSNNLKVVEFFGAVIPHVFCSLAKALRYEYGFLQCPSIGNKLNPSKDNLIVEPAKLLQILRQLGVS